MFGLPSQPNQGMGSAWGQQGAGGGSTPSAATSMGSLTPSSMGMGSGMGGMGSMPMGSNPMSSMGGMGAMSSMPMSSASMMNPAASSMMNPAMQALYQQYALRWAAFQKLAAGQQPSMSMGSMNPMAMQAMMAAQPGMMGMGGMMGGQMGDMSGAAATGATGTEGGGGSGGGGGIYFKTRMCNKWKEGLCPFPSENCRYAHGEAELRTAADNERLAQGGGLAQLDKRGMINLMKKTRLCQEFMTTSMCRYGDKCTFAHGYHELRTPPTGGAGAVNAMKPKSTSSMIQGGKDLRKTRLCEKFMMTGMCGYGPGCTFAHGVHDLRGPNDPLPPSLADKPAPGAAAQTGSVIGPSAPEMYGADMSAYTGLGDDGTGATAAAAMPSVGAKRGPEEAGLGTDASIKRQQLEPEENPDTSCHLCGELVQAGRSKVLNGLNALENPKAQQLGVMILATSQRLDQLWSRCTPAAVLGWMSKTQGLTVMDKIELLRTLYFHAHANQPNARTPEGGLGLDSQKYVDRGLPPHCADFVYVCLEGKEGTATMSEYFHMLEVCKQLFGINDENYYAVSTEVASIMMGM